MNQFDKYYCNFFFSWFYFKFYALCITCTIFKLTSLVSLIQNKTSYIRKSIFFQVLEFFSSFFLLSLFTIFLKFAGYQIGWGFQFQNQYFLFFNNISFAFGLNILVFFRLGYQNCIILY